MNIRFLASLISICLLPVLAHAQVPSDTLDKLRRTHVLAVGIRDNTLPFSTLSQGMAIGYSVDLCNKVLDAARRELKLPDLRIKYVPVSSSERIGKIQNGEIDMECATSVNTKSRQADVAFSYSFFFGSERLLVRSNSGIQDTDGLAGKNVAVVRGSTAEKIFAQMRTERLRTMNLMPFSNNMDAFHALEGGKVAAFAQLDILLEAARLQSHTPDAFVLTSKSLSVEPMAIIVRKNDKAFQAFVDKTLGTLYSSGEINAIYDRWFNTGIYQFPMSKILRESITHPSHDAAVALGLGYEL
jgi:glutamate/aspartate transport system substrate-binding protein